MTVSSLAVFTCGKFPEPDYNPSDQRIQLHCLDRRYIKWSDHDKPFNQIKPFWHLIIETPEAAAAVRLRVLQPNTAVAAGLQIFLFGDILVTTIFRSLCTRHVIFLCRWLYCFCGYVLFFGLNFKMDLRRVLQAVLLPLRFTVVKRQAQQCTLVDKQGEETSSALLPPRLLLGEKRPPAIKADVWNADEGQTCSKDNFLPWRGRHNGKKCVHGHPSA